MSGKPKKVVGDNHYFYFLYSASMFIALLKQVCLLLVLGNLSVNPMVWLLIVTGLNLAGFALIPLIFGFSRPWWWAAITIVLLALTVIMGLRKDIEDIKDLSENKG